MDQWIKEAEDRLRNRDQESISVGNTFAAIVRKTTIWYFVLAPLTLLYLGIALHFAWNIRPISRLIGLPENEADAVLLDLSFVMLPLVGAIAIHLFFLKKRKILTRRELIAEFNERELVQANMNQNLIYSVLTRQPDESIGKMQLVWTPDGRCANGVVYDNVDEASVSTFDAIRFLNG